MGRTSKSNKHTGHGTVRPMVLAVMKLVMLPLANAAPMTLWQRKFAVTTHADGPKDIDNPNLWAYLSVAIALVLLGGAFAGLTIALMGQDETYLQVMASSGEGSERKHATKVLNLLKKGKHWVLVTLLLSNVITNETLPIVLDRSLGGGWPAVLSSTVLIVIFGEVVPQSICVRYGLAIGAFMAPSVTLLMWIMFPIAWPTAKLLDWLLGEGHGTTYKKAGLKTLVQLHRTLGTTPAERLIEDEVTIINSVLDLKEKPVGDIMTPMGDVFTMSADTVLDERMMDTILSQGYSRIPVYAPDNARNFVGMLLVKILITYDPEDCMRVRDFALATLPETLPYTSCLDILNFFQEGKSHMVLVSDFPGQSNGALGVVTLEDVIEELIGEEIVDESDVFTNVHKAIRRLHPAPKSKFKPEPSEPAMSDSERDGREDQEDTPLLRNGSSERHKDASNVPYSANTLTMRRKSSATSESTERPRPIALRADSAADLKQHLKHLGPSNAASKPKATKYTSVKIKPGVGTIPEGEATNAGESKNTPPTRSSDVIVTPAPTNGEPHGIGENMGLLDKAGKEASDAVVAVHAGYGAMETSPIQRKQSSERMTASEASQVARDNTTASPPAMLPTDSRTNTNRDKGSSANSFPTAEKLIVGRSEEEDDIGDLDDSLPSRSRSRRTARTGSITETMVHAGGVKKVVLETTSSSEETEENRSGSHLDQLRQSNGVDDAKADGETNGNHESDGGTPKRKKRGRKKRGGE